MNIYGSSMLWYGVLDRVQMTVTLVNALEEAVRRDGRTGFGAPLPVADGQELDFEGERCKKNEKTPPPPLQLSIFLYVAIPFSPLCHVHNPKDKLSDCT